MNGFLIKNGANEICFAVINEPRKIQRLTFFSDTRSLSVTFTTGEEEALPTPIDPQFEPALFGSKSVFIGHFADIKLDRDPSDEYYVPLAL